MGILADRFAAVLATHGEALSFTKLGGLTAGQPFARVGLVAPLDAGTRSAMLDSVELMALTLPALRVTLDAAAGDVQAADTFTRDGVTYTVLKVFENYARGALVSKTVVAGL